MSFSSLDKSVSDSAPVELYTFQQPYQTTYLTSAAVDVVFNGNVYTSYPLSRNPLPVMGISDTYEMVVMVPVMHQLMQDNIGGIPDRELLITITRVQGPFGLQIWQGYGTGLAVTGNVASIRIPLATDDAFSVDLPSIAIGRTCPWVLYSTPCSADPNGFLTRDTSVTVLSADGKTVTVGSVFSNPDQWYQGGDIQQLATTERRTILSHVGNVLTLNFPFRTLAVAPGNVIRLRPGCDKAPRTCSNKFSNLLNFGNFPNLPTINIFEDGL